MLSKAPPALWGLKDLGRAGASRQLTADEEAGRALCMARVTGVMTSIFLLDTEHKQLHGHTLLHHLILGAREELQRALTPLHAGTRSAQLTAQAGRHALIYLLGLQLPDEVHRCSCKAGTWRERRAELQARFTHPA